jgi:prepilin-type N-terminal cleavage/methylation domain-containing protein
MNLGRKQAFRRAGAFTLIEIMMVVAIIGLTLVMGLPSFLRVLKRDGMRKAEYDLLAACKDARRTAIIGNQTADLVIHPKLRTLEAPGGKSEEIPNDVIIDVLGVNFVDFEQQDTARVRFFPNGTSDEFTILMHSSGAYVKIYLDTITALPVVENVR